ncbi:uncharacterized protein LOC123213138 isoform X2 [Mangifera indica]|nr:uncharacterized protein LOC123213138 isoform X2 [Mangifera indica]XP_044488458.1 uncharacterized protein LOC123213138 isoform X2 [Mangifera indica]
MPAVRHFARVNTLEIKSHIERKLGHLKSETYFDLLTRFLNGKLGKSEFGRLCIGTIGIENMRLHKLLIVSMLKNACVAKTPPLKATKADGSFSDKLANGYQRECPQTLGEDITQFPLKGRAPNINDCKFKDHPRPLASYGHSHSIVCKDSVQNLQEQQSATELLSLGSRPPCSVEEGEEVEQDVASPSIYSRSPVRAPLGIPRNSKETQKVLHSRLGCDYYTEICEKGGQLPDTRSLKTRLEQKLDKEGFNVSVDCVNLLNNGLDVYLKRLIKPCLDHANSRFDRKHMEQRHGSSTTRLNNTLPVRYIQNLSGSTFVSLLDFQIAMESNPQILGVNWPTLLEEIYLYETRRLKTYNYTN